MSESEFTSIQITRTSKNQLDKIKAEKGWKNYSLIIEKLLELYGGALLEDVITIEREPIAFTLKSWKLNSSRVTNKDITYKMLRTAKVGDVYTCLVDDDNLVGATATVIYRNLDDVVLLVEDMHIAGGEKSSITSLAHISLF